MTVCIVRGQGSGESARPCFKKKDGELKEYYIKVKSLTFTPLSFLRKALLCIKSDCLFAVNGAELWNQKQVLYSPSACDYALGRNKKGRVPSLETDGIPTLLYHPDSLSLRHMEQLPPLVWVGGADILIMSISPSGHESARASFCLVSFPWTSHFNCHI